MSGLVEIELWPRRGLFERYEQRDELIEEICERLARGEPLAVICRDQHMPSLGSVYAWRADSEVDAERIARARLIGEDVISTRLRLVAAGDPRVSSGDVQRDKLMIDTDFKLLAKWNPKVWGDNMQLRHADADGQKLDTAPLVNELLTLLPGDNATNITPVAKPAQRTVQLQLINSSPTAQPAPRKIPIPRAAGPAYRPRARHYVDDLV